MTKTKHPGELLKGRFLDPLGITPYRLAQEIGVHVSRVSQLIKGKRSLTPDTAVRLGLYFGVPAHWWLDMQMAYDLANAARIRELKDVVRPLERPPGTAIGPDGVRVFHSIAASGPPDSEVQVTAELLQLLKSQASLSGRRSPREVASVEYDSGYKAIVGSSK